MRHGWTSGRQAVDEHDACVSSSTTRAPRVQGVEGAESGDRQNAERHCCRHAPTGHLTVDQPHPVENGDDVAREPR